jgi:hypothetical protein
VKKNYIVLLTVVATLTLAPLVGCKHKTQQLGDEEKTATQQPAQQNDSQQDSSQSKKGTVLEAINTSGYTYIHVDTGSEKIWAAAPELQVKTGDSVTIPAGSPMPNYHSKSLNRDFEMVYFVSSISVNGAPAAAANSKGQGNPMMPGMKSQGSGGGMMPGMTSKRGKVADIDLSGIEKAAGGKTVAEIYSDKANLGGKEILVRGKVVKFLSSIMGKNWIHLRDGSGSEGTNDLTVTTDATVQVGDTVLVSGSVTVDKDFGAGYRYAIIVEDAKVSVEK